MEIEERSDKSKEWLLKDQARRLEVVEDYLKDYDKMNTVINNLKKMVAELVLEEKRVDDEMTSIRYKITVQERKVREINKMLRDKNDVRIKDPREG
jgi:hypothetical protein